MITDIKTDERFMNMALDQAAEAARAGEVPVGAVLVDADGRILAEEHNQPITLSDPTAHAEVLALRAAAKRVGNYRLPGTTLYVTLEPCVMCMGALLHARVERLVFGAKDPKGGGAGSCFDLTADPRLNHALEVRGGVLEHPCRRIVQDFFQNKR